MVSMALFGATGAALAVSGAISAEREAGWTRQLRLTPLPGWVYVHREVIVALIVGTRPPSSRCSWWRARPARATAAGTTSALAAAVLPDRHAAVRRAGDLLRLSRGGPGQPADHDVQLDGLSIFGGLWMPIETLPSAMRPSPRRTPTYQLAEMSRGALTGGAPRCPASRSSLRGRSRRRALAAWRYRSDTVSASSALA